MDSMIHIGFVGRLEKEKGIDILIQVIQKIQCHTELQSTVMFHIVGDGSYREILKELQSICSIKIYLYGKLSHTRILTEMKKWNLLCMPSRFLETFGLVALESLTEGVMVCGPKTGGLKEFIPDELAINMDHPVDDILKIIQKIKSGFEFPLQNIEQYSLSLWRNNLHKILNGRKNILIIHDYIGEIGGAEVYIDFLQKELSSMGCTIHRYGFAGNLSRPSRIVHMLLTPIAFWRYFEIKDILTYTQKDLIWIHSVLRYVGPWGMGALHESSIPTIISHHDLGLIVARPSRLGNEGDIPHSFSFESFIQKSHNPLEWILQSIKFLSVKIIWKFLTNVEAHIVPAYFMKKPFREISEKEVVVFPHTLMTDKQAISGEGNERREI